VPITRQIPVPLRVLLGSQFGVFFLGNGLSLTGTWMQRIACSWLVWDWTHSAFWVGIVAAGDLLPVVAIAPFAGVAADRWDRLKMNIASQSLSALLAVLMAVLLAFGLLGLMGVVVLISLQGMLTAATQPSRFAMVQQMVAREEMSTAVGLNSVNVNLARLIGPAIAGAMILHWDILWVFVANAAVTVLFVLVLLRIRLAPRPGAKLKLPFLTEMVEGFAYVLHAQALRLILLTLLFGGSLARSVMELLPAVAARSFEQGAAGLALLTSAASVGAMVAGLTVGRTSAARILSMALVWWGGGAIVAIVLTQTREPWLAVASVVLLGALITRSLVAAQTFVQITTPDALRGRALSAFGLIARGSPALGALGIGYAADQIGLDRAVLVSSGALLLVLVLLIWPIRRAAQRVQHAD